jgi:hypothetical protein
MANTRSIRFQFEPLRSLAFGSISGTYAGVGTALSHPARGYIIENLTDETVTFSFDGVNDHFVLPTNGLYIQDVTTNRYQDDGFFLAEGERLYVKGSPTAGSVYFSVQYGAE